MHAILLAPDLRLFFGTNWPYQGMHNQVWLQNLTIAFSALPTGTYANAHTRFIVWCLEKPQLNCPCRIAPKLSRNLVLQEYTWTLQSFYWRHNCCLGECCPTSLYSGRTSKHRGHLKQNWPSHLKLVSISRWHINWI